MKKRIFAGLLAIVVSLSGCAGGSTSGNKQAEAAQGAIQAAEQEADQSAVQEAEQSAAQGVTQESAEEQEQSVAQEADTAQTAKGIRGKGASEFEPIESENGNIVILYTNDVHCAVEKNIGYAGLAAYKNRCRKRAMPFSSLMTAMRSREGSLAR